MYIINRYWLLFPASIVTLACGGLASPAFAANPNPAPLQMHGITIMPNLSSEEQIDHSGNPGGYQSQSKMYGNHTRTAYVPWSCQTGYSGPAMPWMHRENGKGQPSSSDNNYSATNLPGSCQTGYSGPFMLEAIDDHSNHQNGYSNNVNKYTNVMSPPWSGQTGYSGPFWDIK